MLHTWRAKRNKKGITLIELMLALLITTVVIGAVYGSFRAGLSTWKRSDVKTTVYQNVRITLDQMTREIRSIFANPDNPAIKFIGSSQKLGFVCSMPPSLVEGINGYDLHSVMYFVADSKWEKGKALWKYDEVKPILPALSTLNLMPLADKTELEDEIIEKAEELLPMINEIKFRYYGEDSWQDEWWEEGEAGAAGLPAASSGLPKAIEITIVLQYDEKGEYKETFYTTEDIMINK